MVSPSGSLRIHGRHSFSTQCLEMKSARVAVSAREKDNHSISIVCVHGCINVSSCMLLVCRSHSRKEHSFHPCSLIPPAVGWMRK